MEPLALTAAGLNLVQTAMRVANRVQLLAALDLLTGNAMGAAFTPAQRKAMTMLAVQLHGQGFAIGLVFFGISCVICGALIAHSGLVPRILGWLPALAGVACLVNSIALLLAPSFAGLLFPAVMLPVLVGETSFALWLTLSARPPRTRLA